MPLSAQRRFQSDRIGEFRESVIREMTRLALLSGAVNLAQGFRIFRRLRRSRQPPSGRLPKIGINIRSLGE